MNDQLLEGFEADWISEGTWLKEQHFRGLLEIHLTVCNSIFSRHKWARPPYRYWDLHAGPGYLKDRYRGGQSYPGSPAVFLETAGQQLDGYGFKAMFFERRPEVADQLRYSVSCLFPGLRPSIFAEPCEDVMERWLQHIGRDTRQLGLIYSDPIGTRIPVDLLKHAAAALPKVDILCHVAANSGSYKRGGREYGGQHQLADDIRAIGKDYFLIREPYGPWQWTFVFLTNWDRCPEWKRAGFHRGDIPGYGQDLLERLDLTKRELHARRNTPLPFGLTAPTPSTSGTPDSLPSGRRSSSGPVESVSGADSGQPASPTISPTRPGEPSTSPRTSSPSATNATAERTGRSDDDDA